MPRPDVSCNHRVEATHCSRRRDGVPKAMFGMALQPGSPCEHLVGHDFVGLYPHNTRPARRERARLVESDQPPARELFERARLADQAATPRQPPDAE
jgi:hypothetical protein